MATLHSPRKSISVDVFTFFFWMGNITAVRPTALSAIFLFLETRPMNFFFKFGNWATLVQIPAEETTRRTRICSEMFASALTGYR
jgi:hypothetical protein